MASLQLCKQMAYSRMMMAHFGEENLFIIHYGLPYTILEII